MSQVSYSTETNVYLMSIYSKISLILSDVDFNSRVMPPISLQGASVSESGKPHKLLQFLKE